MMNNKFKGIYIHIPFCKTICNYCDFAKVYYDEEMADKYLSALEKEFSNYNIDKNEVESIYIGGGTPTSLNEKQLKQLLKWINYQQYPNLKEYTIEVNPESMNITKIKLLKEYGINRVSIGVQTFNNELLKSLNRQHDKDSVINLINDLRNNDIDNISVDLMYGLNNQTINDIKEDIILLDQLNIKHIAAYSLILEEGTIFSHINYEKDDDQDYELEQYLHQLLKEEGFEHYEVSNYAKDKQYSYHNLLYWTSAFYLGIGLGAGSYDGNKRWYNTKSITNYLKNRYNREIEYLNTLKDKLSDDIVVQFRKFNGIDLDYFMERYEVDFTNYFISVIIKDKEMLYINENTLYFTDKGQKFLNNIILDFLNELEE